MRPEFSEFQFAYGCTRELEEDGISWLQLPPLGMPEFPTPWQEHLKGFDVCWRVVPVFVQYKRAHYIVRPSGRQWAQFRCPYFRFAVDTTSSPSQHSRLVQLGRREQHTYYCSPGFIYYREYCDRHRRRALAQSSAFIQCSQFPEADHGQRHSITYAMGSSTIMWCSGVEPVGTVILGAAELVRRCRQDPDSFDTISSVVRRLEALLELEPGWSEGEGTDGRRMAARVRAVKAAVMERYEAVLMFLRQADLAVGGAARDETRSRRQ